MPETESPILIEELLGGLLFVLTVCSSLIDMTFIWRMAFSVSFVVLFAHWWLVAPRLKRRIPSPAHRVIASIIFPGLVLCALWNPLRTKYMHEHEPPSFAYVTPAVVMVDSSEWLMMVSHYGNKTVTDPKLLVDDDTASLIRHGQTFTPARPPLRLTFSEIDKFGNMFGNTFILRPTDLNHEHYTIVSQSPTGSFYERLRIERVKGSWQFEMWIQDMQNQDIVFACRDSLFPMDSPFQDLPPVHLRKVPQSCFSALGHHQGDEVLPLSIPATHRLAISLLIACGFAVFLLNYVPIAFMLTERAAPHGN